MATKARGREKAAKSVSMNVGPQRNSFSKRAQGIFRRVPEAPRWAMVDSLDRFSYGPRLTSRVRRIW